MATRETVEQTSPRLSWATSLFRGLASLQLGTILMLVLVVVMMAATWIEKEKGLTYALWYVYRSPWFLALEALLAVNILAAILRRYPWGRAQWKFLVTHGGVLVVLFGAMQTYFYGVEGTLSFSKGESVSEFFVPDQCRVTVARYNPHSGQGSAASSFIFTPGPVQWPEGKSLDLGYSGGLGLTVLRYLPHAEVREDWTIDPTGEGYPAVEFALLDADGRPLDSAWLAGGPMTSRLEFGALKLELQKAGMNSLAEDFLHPPKKGLGQDGILAIHYQDRRYAFPVGENLGKKIALGKSGVAVEIAEYLPDAQPGEGGKFISKGAQPLNPMLDLRIHLPGQETPLRQIAFAKHPLLNFELMRGRNYPVKFWFHHPAVGAASGIEFLKTPDGKLYYRVGIDGKYQEQGEARPGKKIALGGRLQIEILKFLPAARQETAFVPAAAAAGDAETSEPAVLVEVDAEDAPQKFWLRRNDPDYGIRMLATSEGPLRVSFGNERVPLEFKLKLLRRERGVNPGGVGVASYSSTVQLIDRAQGLDQPREIFMNHPLVHRNYIFYLQELPEDAPFAVLGVNYDPGRLAKHLGSILVGVGLVLTFFRNKRGKKALAAWQTTGSVIPGEAKNPVRQEPLLRSGQPDFAMKKIFPFPGVARLFGAALIVLAVAAGAPAADSGGFDWEAWRELPVQEGGRYKPFDTLARETVQTLCHRPDFIDPETGRKLSSVEFYLTLLLSKKTARSSERSADESFRIQAPDAWDKTPLLYVGPRPLRRSLGLPENEKYVTPWSLDTAEYRDAASGREISFLQEIRKLMAHQRRIQLTSEEQEVLRLADAFDAYQELRRGKQLRFVPLPGGVSRPWMTAGRLLQAGFADADDPSGLFRKAQTEFRRVQSAFQSGDAKNFNAASAALFNVLDQLGRQVKDYPSRNVIALEAAYNRAAPFRVAWILTGGAFVLSLAAGIFRRRLFHRAAWIVLGAALAVMLIGFAMRAVISGWAPVTNMYETVIYLALGTTVFGLMFEVSSPRRYVLTAAAAVSTFALILADHCPMVLNPSFRPLMPALRDNYWLTIHVMSIMLGYAAFALAWALGNMTIGLLSFRRSKDNFPGDQDTVAALNRLIYRTLQIGVFLLTLGTIMGAVWAEYAWGRFWGWDPKEVWALITLLVYLALLHARRLGWVKNLGLAAGSVVCFVFVIWTWYWVNFVMGTGLHSYGFGGGGQIYVYAAVFLQLLYLLAAISVRRSSFFCTERTGRADPPSFGAF